MRTLILLSLLALTVACNEPSDETFEYPAADYSPPAPVPSFTPETFVEDEPTVRTSHNYDEKDGVFYSYIAAVSEDERKQGKRAGTAVTFAYLGVTDGKHILARVRPNGAILGRSSCREPCRVITYDDGTQIGFDKGSVIGAAFDDAIAGRMVIAEISTPQQTPVEYRPHPSTSPSPISMPQPTDARWTAAEANLISEWTRLNFECESAAESGIDTSSCVKRDSDIGPKIAAENICLGKVYEDRSESGFHRCTGDSLRLD